MQRTQAVYLKIRDKILNALDAEAVSELSVEMLREQIRSAVNSLLDKEPVPVPALLRSEFVSRLIDEITGLGPLQPLIDDPGISDIMVNGPHQIYVERQGKLVLTDVSFIDENQLLGIAKRMAAQAGRRVDESQPMCDARLMDGSRINIAIPPVALDGTAISIRKFGRHEIRLEDMVQFGTLSPEIFKVLAVAARCRLNVLVSGGTGSGKTTMLNALSQHIAQDERIITIEDTAELSLQQPHVVRMETRPAGIENTGEITQRNLVINSLRMRPDRIILGECRGPEAFEMLQAMNTGHDGSMSTLHANSPRDALARVESMVMMATPNLPLEAIRRHIASAVDLVIQISRLHDGSRKVMSVSEIVGIEGDTIVIEEIFRFTPDGENHEGKVRGEFSSAGLINRSVLRTKARFFGVEDTLNSAFSGISL